MKSSLQVHLITHTPEPEKVIAGAAKLCYSPKDIQGTMEQSDQKKNQEFVKMLVNMGHESPLEHISFTFGIEGVSRSLTHQLVRHRIGASYSQKSQRYVEEKGFKYIIPPAVEENSRALSLYEKSMEESAAAYNEITELLYSDHIESLMNQGKTEKMAKKEAKKKAIEDARFVLPNACETKIIVTMNARALLHFFNHRCCNRAQWEIQELAIEMLRKVKRIAPTVFDIAGPKCLEKPCPEGSMTCGQVLEVRERFRNLQEERVIEKK